MPRKRASDPTDSTNTTTATSGSSRSRSGSNNPPKKKRKGGGPNHQKRTKAATNNNSNNSLLLKVIPPDLNDKAGIQILQALDEHLRCKRVQKLMTSWCPKGLKSQKQAEAVIPGIRIINGNRFEVFVSASTKNCQAFDQLIQDWIDHQYHSLKEKSKDDNEIIESSAKEQDNDDNNKIINVKYPALVNLKSVADIRSILLNYAIRQAERDPRIGGDGEEGEYTFDNFSLLLNFTGCDGQFPHIDLLEPNIQCGLVITDSSPATVAYQVPGQNTKNIRTVSDLKRILWKDIPDEVFKAIENDEQCVRMIRQFGNTLYPLKLLQEQKISKRLKRGSLLTLPGGQIHSGPKSTKCRCVLFFSGQPNNNNNKKDKKETTTGSSSSAASSSSSSTAAAAAAAVDTAGYDPDTQYFGPLVIADLLMQLFHVLSVEGRKYLVHQLAIVIPTYKNLYRHLEDEAMRKFCNALGWAQYGKGGKKELIQKFCEGRGIVPKGGTLENNDDDPADIDGEEEEN